jgi:hypothetical protein
MLLGMKNDEKHDIKMDSRFRGNDGSRSVVAEGAGMQIPNQRVKSMRRIFLVSAIFEIVCRPRHA